MFLPAALDDRPAPRVSWGAALGGAVISLAILCTISHFFIAIGLYGFDPLTENPTLAGAAFKTMAGWTMASLIATFCGAWAGSKLAHTTSTGVSVLHGILVWAISSVAMGLLATTFIGALAGGAFSVIGKALAGAAEDSVRAAPQSAVLRGGRARLA
jgi:hypothetical protein